MNLSTPQLFDLTVSFIITNIQNLIKQEGRKEGRERETASQKHREIHLHGLVWPV